MYHFYREMGGITGTVTELIGPDVNHIRNVLRMKVGEELILCDGEGTDYHCSIQELQMDRILLNICKTEPSPGELKTRLYLFQGLPKRDKMELIVQKAVELGVYEVIPVIMKRSVVKLEDSKKEKKKLERWQAIAESAAKQSGRGIIPRIGRVLTYKEALEAAAALDYVLLPYEKADGIEAGRKAIAAAAGKSSVGILIGPEGGFEEEEAAAALEKEIQPITLGHRILRTETAGLAILSLLMYQAEHDKTN